MLGLLVLPSVIAPPAPAPVAAPASAAVPMNAPPAAPMAGLSHLLLPVQGVTPAQLVDTYTQSRGAGRSHDAIDIMAARGTPVVAVADGRVVKLFLSKPGGMTIYEFDPEEKVAYYYAHLNAYAPGMVEGKQVKRGEVIGYVGSTGNASPDAPHLHFAIFLLGPEKRWWQGTAINPFALLGGVSH
jgi:murein DD-endopeptidase MepM/ murein hydrolase activator NlpD